MLIGIRQLSMNDLTYNFTKYMLGSLSLAAF